MSVLDPPPPPKKAGTGAARGGFNPRVVNGEDEVIRRRAWLHQLAMRTEPNADGFPAVQDLEDLAGTWLERLSWVRRKSSKEDHGVYVPASSPGNVVAVLRNDPRWKDVIAYDEFSEGPITTRLAPWDPDAKSGAKLGDWAEVDTTRARCWLDKAYGIRAPQTLVDEAVAVVARGNLVHPVRSYLRALEWDGVERISTWISVFLGADDTPYTRAVGRAWLISAVARIMRPGCKVDTMLVLEGEQGTRKSSALRTLAGEPWFTELSGAIDPRDTPIQLRRKWIAEFSELSAFRRTREQETIRGFLSRQTDNYRAPYARTAKDYPRQAVFAGSTNDDKYLKDPTGGRRIWPIRCGVIYIRGLEIERDQLWAEAVHAFNAGEKWYLDDEEIVRAAVSEQSERYEEDAWTDTVQDFCLSRALVGVTTEDVLGTCLGIETGKWTHADLGRIGGILRRMGWRPVGRARPRRYKP